MISMKSLSLIVKAEKKGGICLSVEKGDIMILAGDIGGTHTRLALFENGKKVGEKKFSSQDYQTFEEIVREFLDSEQKEVERACFGIAGSVREGKCKLTNLSWTVDSENLRSKFKMKSVSLINDLESNAYGLRVVKEDELYELHPGKSGQKGNQALIAAGTGLGEAGLIWNGRNHTPFACEGGHVDFAARDDQEYKLFQYLEKKFGHVSYERAVSGPGLLELYRFLVETQKEPESKEVKEAMEEKDPSAVVSQYAVEGKDAACVHALKWFVSLYGAKAGNLALQFLALGGVFIGGGIAPAILDQMKDGFVRAFMEKGRFKELLMSIPIKVILNDEAALLGAAYHAEHFDES